jgi:hypothetical protein
VAVDQVEAAVGAYTALIVGYLGSSSPRAAQAAAR